MAEVTATRGGAVPLQGCFSPFPFVCFTLALATDIAFFATANLMWQNFSAWLLFAGLFMGAIALLAGIVDVVRPRTKPLRASLATTIVFLFVLALALLNSFVHAGDGWTAVVPFGLALSIATFIMMLLCLGLSARRYANLAWRV